MRNYHSIENLLIHNRVLDNNSNKINKVYFDSFSGNTEIKIATGGTLNNGYIYIDVDTDSRIEIFYNDILIFSSQINKQMMIPCLFEDDSQIKINGDCKNLTMLIYGAEIISSHCDYHLPLKNMLLRYVGDSHSLYNYADYASVKNNQLSYIGDYQNLIDCQVFAIDDSNYTAILTRGDNGLNLQTDIDNYAEKYIIIDNFESAVIVPDPTNNRFFVVYIKQGKLYYKIVLADMTINEETEITNIFDDKVKNFSRVSIYGFSSALFAVNLNNNKTLIMVLIDGEFRCRLIKKSRKTEVLCDNNSLEICTYDSNIVTLSRYNVVSIDGEISIVPMGQSKQILNVDKVLKIGSMYLLFNGENCTEVDYESLFGN